jgi:hypothetical protein
MSAPANVFATAITQAQLAIARYGALCTWNQNTNTQNSGQPWKTAAASPTQYNVNICFIPQGNSIFDALIHMIKGTSVPDGAQTGLMGAVSFTPAIDDEVVFNGVNLVVKSIDVLQPNGTPILYTIIFG